ncbi:MAG: Fis family transcriptional regulator [Methylobacter sp.]|nr:MAG: Fis family transcriptional regulator [Methylobacter sp.]
MPAANCQNPIPSINSEELAALAAIMEGTASATGEQFFQLLVSNLSKATGIANAFIAVFGRSKTQVQTLAFWQNGKLIDNQLWDLDGTPCQVVLQGELCHFPTGVSRLFPKEKGIESYLGVRLETADGEVLGHLAIYDEKPMPPESKLIFIFKIFAARAASEISRIRMVDKLQQSEQRFRDLFDEAPIAYVNEDMESRFISANRAAMRTLGITPDQVNGMTGRSLVPDTEEALKRFSEAFQAIGRGTDTGGVIMELMRKDNGKPLWIEWWSNPDPSGEFTRTMFVDITEKVLMEQEKNRLQAQNLYLQEEINASANSGEIQGRSMAVQNLLKQVRRVAPTDASVLIQGESGTGKELIARAIHAHSRRSSQPLIKVNCAALPTGLIESELFGHEKGAFTGALAKRIGRFELADGGTIFLDEIGEIPMDIQVKLLRVLQEREFERVGGQKPIKVDVRIIAATNRNLLQEVAEKNFREDLFYRLNVFPLTTPPLRERREDIPLLAYFMVRKFAPRIGKKIDGISEQAMQRLRNYPWPGNIRELENVIERAIILTDGAILEIDRDMLPGGGMTSDNQANPADTDSASFESVTRQHIINVLKQTNWVIEGANGAAKILNMQPSTLRYRIKKLGISKDSR